MADYISRDYTVENMENYPWDTEHDKNAAIHLVRELVPAADVRPVDAISGSVDEAIAFLNSVSNQMPYHVYSALFDLIYAILPTCGADMREVKSDEK